MLAVVPFTQNPFSPLTVPTAEGTCHSPWHNFTHVSSFTDLVRRPVDIKGPVDTSNHSGTSDDINKSSGAPNFKAKYKDQ